MLYSDAMEVELALKDYEKYLAEVPDDKAMFFNVGLSQNRKFQQHMAMIYKTLHPKP